MTTTNTLETITTAGHVTTSDASTIEAVTLGDLERLSRRKSAKGTLYWEIMDAYGVDELGAVSLCRRAGLDPDTGRKAKN